MTTETWRKFYENYEVSNLGRVKSLTRKNSWGTLVPERIMKGNRQPPTKACPEGAVRFSIYSKTSVTKTWTIEQINEAADRYEAANADHQ